MLAQLICNNEDERPAPPRSDSHRPVGPIRRLVELDELGKVGTSTLLPRQTSQLAEDYDRALARLDDRAFRRACAVLMRRTSTLLSVGLGSSSLVEDVERILSAHDNDGVRSPDRILPDESVPEQQPPDIVLARARRSTSLLTLYRRPRSWPMTMTTKRWISPRARATTIQPPHASSPLFLTRRGRRLCVQRRPGARHPKGRASDGAGSEARRSRRRLPRGVPLQKLRRPVSWVQPRQAVPAG